MLPTLLLLTLGQSTEPVDDRLEKARDLVHELANRAARTPSELEVTRAEGDRPHLDYAREVWCVELKKSTAVPSGRYRVQCDDGRQLCFAAPDRVLRDGVETEEELQRTAPCGTLPPSQLEKLSATHRFVEAVAEAPDGWYRDDQGRIIQVNFDLHRRVYFGGAWAPSFRPGAARDLSLGSMDLGRGRADFGIELELANDAGRELHRLHILEGSAFIGSRDTRLMATAIRYDWSSRRLAAPVWITTFVGRPRRLDLDVNLAGWFEAVRFELISDQGFLTLASANASIDLWHSRDLQSYLRVRAGPAGEFDLQTRSVSLRPEAALEADFTLDRDGFHHLTGAVTGEKLFFDQALAGRRKSPERFKARLGYELILLAINDYPLTLVVDGRAQWRDDLPGVTPGWDFGVDAGLRFSFWAPARRSATQVFNRTRG
ncbi:MAG: hypothetical protein IPJ65_30970 [Archangiaceae bacterium]|nr:hypothetical protein [Archangiaceae bacterium]